MKSKQITIVGFGKIGQALAAHMLLKGAAVIGIDIDVTLRQHFADGTFKTNEPGVQEILQNAFADNSLRFSADPASANSSDAIIIAIPLSVDDARKPLSKPFVDSITAFAPFIKNNVLISVETSVPVGFCRSLIVPALEREGRLHGRDYLLVHSPERIKSGTMLKQLAGITKIIGGIDDTAATAAKSVYADFFNEDMLVLVGNIEAAELVKMAGMMYRDINIALANQLAVFADSINVDLEGIRQLINGDNEASLLQQGIGVGGHCTPVYPYFMMESFRQAGMEFTLASEARKINEGMGAYAASMVAGMPAGKALILGLAFRPGVKEDAFSPAYSLELALHNQGWQTIMHDPLYSATELAARGFTAASDIYTSGAELVFIVTMHAEYAAIDYGRLYEAGIRMLVDGRNSISRREVEDAGITYKGIGH